MVSRTRLASVCVVNGRYSIRVLTEIDVLYEVKMSIRGRCIFIKLESHLKSSAPLPPIVHSCHCSYFTKKNIFFFLVLPYQVQLPYAILIFIYCSILSCIPERRYPCILPVKILYTYPKIYVYMYV